MYIVSASDFKILDKINNTCPFSFEICLIKNDTKICQYIRYNQKLNAFMPLEDHENRLTQDEWIKINESGILMQKNIIVRKTPFR